MKTAIITARGLAWIIIAMLMMPISISAQEPGDTDDSAKFSKEELTQMLAPIALYPDSLTAQILMASTYPLEVVEAERWVRQNKNLTGADLDNALKDKRWDPSVAALCHFPNILSAMSEKLDQTRKLGDAFLSQEADVMATIQELRRKAEAAGNLKTTDKQKVIVEDEDIRIEPAEPDTVYVPVYDPMYVYGPWWYPSYPPYYWYYPPGFVSGAYIGFGPGIYFGFDFFSWCWFDWGGHRIHVDFDRARFHRHDRRDFDDRFWRHNPIHRRGVAYRDRRTSELFGTRSPRVSPIAPETRGFTGRSGVTGRRTEIPSPSLPAIQRGTRSIAPQGSLERRTPGTGERREGIGTPTMRSREAIPRSVQPMPRSIQRDTSFRGIGEGNFEQRAVERGGSSIRSSEQSGGFFRGDGGATRSGGGSSGGGSSGGGSWGGGRGSRGR
ncbi:putative protein [Geobacter sp. OR-1]|uniref:DUF3300 domain-containing protein n=1 Tax=Geobacter sp. OR-1 TaxID=1266765 RepID=UPI0005435525|nr:DUF3300 domain-containing protein [Geobacter sp. OR-1]GAM11072.1 putative protein [Geobacter sp. OR-1]